MQLVFTRRTTNTASIEVIDDEGQPQHQCLLNRFKDKDIRWLAKLWGESVPIATCKLNEVCETESEEPFDVIEFTPADGVIEAIVSGTVVETPETVVVEPITLRVRELSQLQSHSATFSDTDVAACLRTTFEDTWNHCDDTSLEFLIEWNDTGRLCCLDVDYHSIDLEHRPKVYELAELVSQVRPLPFCWHVSHGRGAKLYYISSPGYTAKELASIAGISYLSLDASATFDLIKSTRHPCYARKRDGAVPPIEDTTGIVYLYGNSDLTCVKRLLISELEPDVINEWLEERGYVMGSTLLHSECPIDPTPDHKANVYIGDKGFFCHRCYARGLRNGFVSYGELIGSIDNRIALMVKNFCHLEHARVVLSNIYPNVPIKILEDIYRVMLKITHPQDDPRINIAMKSGTGYIRISGMFVSADGSSALANGLPAFVNSLPATKFVSHEDEGALIPDISRTTAFLNDGDLSEYGYPDITFLRGCRIFGQFNRVDELVKVVTRKEFHTCLPKYVDISTRMPEKESWEILESEFPGINRNYVKLLIATKGASEGRLCQCPFLLVNGPSGAGKSTTVHIAAGICGDKADEPIWNQNSERFRQALMDGVRNSGFICVNEVFKYADKAKVSYTQALDPMLSLTEDSRSHVLYVGSVPFGRLPVFVLTDINIPPEIIADRQLARRFNFFRLDNENFWTDTLVHRRIRPHQFRLISPLHNAAADAILSNVIDTYFLEPTSLAHIVADLSGPDEYTEDVARSKSTLLEFYQAVCAAPPLSGQHTKRYPANGGWKLIDRMCEGQLLSLWGELADGVEPDKWPRSRQIDSVDWSKIVGVRKPIVCEYRSFRGNTIYIRFRSSDSAKQPSWINGL